MKRKWVLAVLIMGILFPLNWLRDESAFIRRYFDAIFEAEWVHIAMHLLLFSMLAVMVVTIFNLPPTLKSALILAGVILVMGLMQEGFQLLTKGRGFEMKEVFDLGVDLVGGALGWLVWRKWTLTRKRNPPNSI